MGQRCMDVSSALICLIQYFPRKITYRIRYLVAKRLPRLFIIAGCNGAGKTTASYTILPDLLNVKEFVNADEIARGLSPFQPDKVSIEAGKIMLHRLQNLLSRQEDFAFETTLSSKNYSRFINQARQVGYSISLVYFWLESVALAVERVKARVAAGGHHIPEEVITRRYHKGLRNFLFLYTKKADDWVIIDNSKTNPEIIAKGYGNEQLYIKNSDKWKIIQTLATDETK